MTRSRYGDENCSRGGEIDVPDVYGALRGLRGFDISRVDHYIEGPYFPVRWVDGVMEAECLQSRSEKKPNKDPMSTWAAALGAITGSLGLLSGIKYVDGKPVRQDGWLPVDCPGIARGNHGCGFYARHGATIPERRHLIAVVDMYGQVELGPTGLRSSKARIRAMVHPSAWGSSAWGIDLARKALAKEIEKRHANAKRRVLDLPGGLPERESADRTLAGNILFIRTRVEAYEKFFSNFDEFTVPLYPSVRLFDSFNAMLEAFPVPPLDNLLVEPDEEMLG